MTVLEVGHLHARYRGADEAARAVLDDALHRVAKVALETELVALPVPDAHAVCVRELTVTVDLDPARPVATLSRTWAAAIAATLQDRLAGGDDVVVYPREIDVLVDVVRSVACGDLSRIWAWRQAGVVGVTPASSLRRDLAAVLARHPALVPAVLVATGDVVADVLDGAGWLHLARAVRPVVGGPTAPAGDAGPPPESATTSLVARARAVIPDAAWRAAAAPDARVALAVLALACVAPALGRDPRTVDRVASASSVALVDRWAPAGAPEGDNAGGGAPAAASKAAVSSTRADNAPPALPSSFWSDAGGPDAIVSRFGGVLFLVHAVTALDLPAALPGGPLADLGPTEVLARILSAAACVAVDDPAVLAAAGWRATDPLDALATPPSGLHAASVGEHAERLRGWVAGRLGDDDTDLDWIWARRATIDARRGWVEATFALHDVDLRLRVAGLDLDPGHVWWLGSVVRFRYV